jgi:hypothetical protein
MMNPEQEQQNRLAQQRRENEQKQGAAGRKPEKAPEGNQAVYQDNPVQSPQPADSEGKSGS